MKHTIIVCDLCGGHIWQEGKYIPFSLEPGALRLSARKLKEEHEGDVYYPKWKRRVYHICPRCVEKIKDICKREG